MSHLQARRNRALRRQTGCHWAHRCRACRHDNLVAATKYAGWPAPGPAATEPTVHAATRFSAGPTTIGSTITGPIARRLARQRAGPTCPV